MKKKQVDILSYIVILIFCLAAYYISLGFSSVQAGRNNADPVGAAGFPQLLIGLMAILSVAGMIKAILSKGENEPSKISLKDLQVLLKFIAVLLIYIFGIRYVGYCVSTVVYAMFSMWWLGVRKPRSIIITGIALTIILYVAFGLLFNADLPSGFLI